MLFCLVVIKVISLSLVSHIRQKLVDFSSSFLLIWVNMMEDINIIFNVPGVDLNSLDPDSFSEILTRFMFSPAGSRFRFLFRYETPIECGKPAPNLTVILALGLWSILRW